MNNFYKPSHNLRAATSREINDRSLRSARHLSLSIAVAEQSKISGCRQNNKYLNFQVDDETCGSGVHISEQQRSDKSTEKKSTKTARNSAVCSPVSKQPFYFSFHRFYALILECIVC